MRKGIRMTLAEVEAHQRKHFGIDKIEAAFKPPELVSAPKDRMNKTEREYAFILEAMKRRGEIVEYRFEGITLSWGIDPETEKPMRYTPDFYVVVEVDQDGKYPDILLIEVKGGHIYSRDLVRFKGCRADWPMFRFEMHQKKEGKWLRIH